MPGNRPARVRRGRITRLRETNPISGRTGRKFGGRRAKQSQFPALATWNRGPVCETKPIARCGQGWQRQAEPAELADGVSLHAGAIGKPALPAATRGREVGRRPGRRGRGPAMTNKANFSLWRPRTAGRRAKQSQLGQGGRPRLRIRDWRLGIRGSGGTGCQTNPISMRIARASGSRRAKRSQFSAPRLLPPPSRGKAYYAPRNDTTQCETDDAKRSQFLVGATGGSGKRSLRSLPMVFRNIQERSARCVRRRQPFSRAGNLRRDGLVGVCKISFAGRTDVLR